MGIQETQYEGVDALIGDYDDMIMTMTLVGINPDEVQSTFSGNSFIIY